MERSSKVSSWCKKESRIQSSSRDSLDSRPSQKFKESFQEYLKAMKKASARQFAMSSELLTPRERHYLNRELKKETMDYSTGMDVTQATLVSTIASMVPDEIIYRYSDYSIRRYELALMFIDISGFTDLCEAYTEADRGGPSRLTQVLNSYLGAMVQEILTFNGDVLNFSGDAFLCMWKKTPFTSMQDVVHAAIDCGIIIQKNYGRHVTDIGIVLKVKVAISAGMSHFALIGDETNSNYVIVGQPVWDVKMAEYMSTAGDVITSASVWIYVNESEYYTHPCGDGRNTKVLGLGVTWKRVQDLQHQAPAPPPTPNIGTNRVNPITVKESAESNMSLNPSILNDTFEQTQPQISFREFSLRPAVVAALRNTWWPNLRRFMLMPVLRAVDNDEPLDFLTEIRHVVVVCLNIITKTVSEDVLISIVDTAYRQLYSIASEAGGLVNKVSTFDKDIMVLIIFGLRGLKHKEEAQKALLCAYHSKEILTDPNIISVSIGVTSGRTYCGVVGHVLRREYTVIGLAVNKAARLMMAYPNIVTCDKETFVRSKLELDFFRIMESVPLKGIKEPGPIYEFNKAGWPDKVACLRTPILGRNEELRKFKSILENAMNRQSERFTRYKDNKYAVAITGPRLVGKARLMDEFLIIASRLLPCGSKMNLSREDLIPYQMVRYVMSNTNSKQYHFPQETASTLFQREKLEDKIRSMLDLTKLSLLQIYALNTVFDCRFPLKEKFTYSGDLLTEISVRELLQEVCKNCYPSLRFIMIRNAEYIDDESWRILLIILDTKCIFVVMAIHEETLLSSIGKQCLANGMIIKMHLTGIERWYHAALVCQLLDVQAIPTDLEKVIESASGGLPGWIQNFLISLIQSGQMTVVTVLRHQAVEAGAVLPSPALLTITELPDHRDEDLRVGSSFISKSSSVINVKPSPSLIKEDNIKHSVQKDSPVQMAVLREGYDFETVNMNVEMDVIIMKTYDSLTPYEKMLLKCGAVLGETFTRRMLLHLLQSDSQIKVARAVAKLFEIRVLECEGGDFTHDTSVVLVHPAPAIVAPHRPYCSCLGTKILPFCQDLPKYAFCGYMKFRHSLFRKTTYELLTDNQKHDLHGRALLFLERYTRRCTACGEGCFVNLFGVRSDDGLVPESKKVKNVRQQIAALSAETRMTSGSLSTYQGHRLRFEKERSKSNITNAQGIFEKLRFNKKPREVRSFASMEVDSCECMPILMTVYSQVIAHCRGCDECEKLFECYMEYCDIILMNFNVPLAIRLLKEVEELVKSDTTNCQTSLVQVPWIKDLRMARIDTNYGSCLLETGEYNEAKKHLLEAMKLYNISFPTSEFKVNMKDDKVSFKQFMALYVSPKFYIGIEKGFRARFYDYVSNTLSKLYRLFTTMKEPKKARLAAKWSLFFAWKSDSNFQILCMAYSNMISIYRTEHKFSKCIKLKQKAMEMCHRKTGQLDVTEVFSVVSLYTNMFLFYVEYGKKSESLEFGLTVVPLMTKMADLSTSQLLILWMLKLLLSELRIHEMVTIMREFFYMTDYYDLSSETWYYYYAILILLDTGYCVESYGTCEKFYIRKGDAIFRSKKPEAAWNFFICMWLLTVRLGAWERSVMWEEKIRKLYTIRTFQKDEFHVMMLVRLLEGYLICLVYEMDNKNVKRVELLKTSVKSIFQQLERECAQAPMIIPRYTILQAYYSYIHGQQSSAYSTLNRAQRVAQKQSHTVLLIWIEHTRKHWQGMLNAKYIDYWADHVDSENLLDYRDFVTAKSEIIPYTLPLPRDLEN